MESRRNKALILTMSLSTLALLAFVLYSVRDILLCCADSQAEFIFARVMDFKWSFNRGFEFCISRGRMGIIFPFVTAVRHSICRTGSYTAVWLMQHVPVYFNVFLISFILGKRTRPRYGFIFAMSFLSFLQINGWHNIIICYPLDFMYGLTLCILGLYLFQLSLESQKSVKRVILMLLSTFFFYESMQTYEAFLLISVVYAWLAFCHEAKMNGPWKGTGKEERRGKIKKFAFESIKDLMPHFVTALVFLGIYIYLHKYPLIEDTGNDLSTLGSKGGFVKTLAVFSGGMFPLANLCFYSVRHAIFEVSVTFDMIVRAVISGIAILSTSLLIYSDRESAKYNRTLTVFSAAGVLGAVFFPAMHSATAHYQAWVLYEHQFGYVPTAISYFGWILGVSAIMGIVLGFAGRRGKKWKISIAAVGVVGFTVCSFVTLLINQAIIDKGIGPANPNMSYRGIGFYALATDKDFADTKCDVLYLKGFSGVHGTIAYNENIMGYEIQINGSYRPVLINSEEEMEKVLKDYEYPYEYRYDYDAKASYLVPIVGTDEDGSFIGGGEIRIVSAPGGEYEVVYTETDGDRQSFGIEVGSWEDEGMKVPEEFDIDTIDIKSK